MTAITAKTAGVKTVWVANPKPDKFALAAAHVAGDALRVSSCFFPLTTYDLPPYYFPPPTRSPEARQVGPGCRSRDVAASAGADGFLKCGGAHAVGALAQGVGKVPQCNIIVGPGNQWVTAAKSIVQGKCAIDMLAG